MKTIITSVAAMAAIAVSSPAWANDSASVEVQSVVDPVCSFTTKPAAVVQVTPTAGEKVLGNLGYTCNFVGSANLVLSLPNGTTLHNDDNGGDNQAYGLRWSVPPNDTSSPYQSFAAGDLGFSWPTAPTANTESVGALAIKLNSDLPVAGTYKSTISYTITP